MDSMDCQVPSFRRTAESSAPRQQWTAVVGAAPSPRMSAPYHCPHSVRGRASHIPENVFTIIASEARQSSATRKSGTGFCRCDERLEASQWQY